MIKKALYIFFYFGIIPYLNIIHMPSSCNEYHVKLLTAWEDIILMATFTSTWVIIIIK